MEEAMNNVINNTKKKPMKRPKKEYMEMEETMNKLQYNLWLLEILAGKTYDTVD